MAAEDRSLIQESPRKRSASRKDKTVSKDSFFRERLNSPFLLPQHIFSIHVDQHYPKGSSETSKHAAELARRFQVEHVNLTIPGSPKKSETPSTMSEELLRRHRQARIFYAINHNNALCVAFGNHADGQVEDSIVRLVEEKNQVGSTVSNVRPIQRWGMGDGSSFSWAGSAGMKHYVTRPLLEVSKDRILATCDANDLEYVTDSTNFQPDVTLRDHVRLVLDNPTSEVPETPEANSCPQRPDILEAIERLNLPEYTHLARSQQGSLREAVRLIGQSQEQLETQVTEFLRKHLLESPPGTALISNDSLDTLTDPATRVALVSRLLRYVSPHPWGSPRADFKGNNHLETIVDWIYHRPKRPRPFRGGSNVDWIPTTIGADGSIKFHPPGSYQAVQVEGVGQGDQVPLDEAASEGTPVPKPKAGWLVRRQLPSGFKKKQQNEGTKMLSCDVTQHLRTRVPVGDASQQRPSTDTDDPIDAHSRNRRLRVRPQGRIWKYSYLWDARVLVVFEHTMIPSDILLELQRAPSDDVRIMIEVGDKVYMHPKVMLKRKGQPDIELARMDHTWNSRSIQREEQTTSEASGKPEEQKPWIRFYFVRPWSAI